MMIKPSVRSSGLSLVEVLVAISVVGVLIGLLLPAIQDVRRTAARADCQNRMRQVGLALHNYHDHHGRLPGQVSVWHVQYANQELCWPAKILPYVEQAALASSADAAKRASPDPYLSPPHDAWGVVVRTYTCPADPRVSIPASRPGGRVVSLTSYAGVSGSFVTPPFQDGMFGSVAGVRFADATDGLSQTLLLGEHPPDPAFESGWWYAPNPNTVLPKQPVLAVTGVVVVGSQCYPNGVEPDPTTGIPVALFVYGPGRFDNPCDVFHFWSPHAGGGNWVFADGSVRFLRYEVRPLMKALATRNRGEVVDVP